MLHLVRETIAGRKQNPSWISTCENLCKCYFFLQNIRI